MGQINLVVFTIWHVMCVCLCECNVYFFVLWSVFSKCGTTCVYIRVHKHICPNICIVISVANKFLQCNSNLSVSILFIVDWCAMCYLLFSVFICSDENFCCVYHHKHIYIYIYNILLYCTYFLLNFWVLCLQDERCTLTYFVVVMNLCVCVYGCGCVCANVIVKRRRYCNYWLMWCPFVSRPFKLLRFVRAISSISIVSPASFGQFE